MADIQATVNAITADIRTIVRGEIELAKAEVIPGMKRAGLGTVLLAGAGIFALLAVNVLFVCLGFAFTNLFWDHTGPVAAFGLGFLCAAGVYLMLAVLLALLGVVNLKKMRKPEAALAQAEATAAAVSGATSAGLAEVELLATRGKKVITTDETGQIVTVFSGPRRLAGGHDHSSAN